MSDRVGGGRLTPVLPQHRMFRLRYTAFRLVLLHPQSHLNMNCRLLFPPFSLYLCSVITKPAFLRSFIALLVVDSDSFRSLEIVGMDGQQMPSLLARSARYLYTEIALWGRSIRYSSVKLRILFPPVQVGLHCPTCFYVLSAVFSGIEAAFRFAFAGRVSSEYTSGYSDRIAFSRIAFPA